MNLGSKIVVLGVSASGKSTFARKLADKMQLPLILMDSIMWNPGWKYIGDKETVRHLDEVSLKQEWIIEGYISTNARAFVLDRADTIIYLDYSSILSSWRYIKRWWTHRKNPRPELPDSPDTFSFKFLYRVWSKAEVKALEPLLKNISDQSKIITFHSPKEAGAFLRQT